MNDNNIDFKILDSTAKVVKPGVIVTSICAAGIVLSGVYSANTIGTKEKISIVSGEGLSESQFITFNSINNTTSNKQTQIYSIDLQEKVETKVAEMKKIERKIVALEKTANFFGVLGAVASLFFAFVPGVGLSFLILTIGFLGLPVWVKLRRREDGHGHRRYN